MNKITHLMPLSKFVLDAEAEIDQFYTRDVRVLAPYNAILAYARFLQRPLTLPDLVPCVNGVPVEEPEYYQKWVNDCISKNDDTKLFDACRDFHEAKANCLFEGFEYLRMEGCDNAITDTIQILFNKYNGKVELYADAVERLPRYKGVISTIEDLVHLNPPP